MHKSSILEAESCNLGGPRPQHVTDNFGREGFHRVHITGYVGSDVPSFAEDWKLWCSCFSPRLEAIQCLDHRHEGQPHFLGHGEHFLLPFDIQP